MCLLTLYPSVFLLLNQAMWNRKCICFLTLDHVRCLSLLALLQRSSRAERPPREGRGRSQQQKPEASRKTPVITKSCSRHAHRPPLFQAGRVSGLDPEQLIRRTVTAPPWEERDSLQLSHIYSSLLHVHFLNIFFLNVISMRLKYNFKNKSTFNDLNYC